MTVLVRLDQTVFPENADRFESWFGDNGPMFRAQKGFQLAVLGNSPGEPTLYTAVSRWADATSFRAFLRGPARKERMEALGQGVATVRRSGQVYEQIGRVGDPVGMSGFAFAVMVEWDLAGGAGAVQDFVKSRQELGELRQKHVKGFLAQSVWRHLGSPFRFLITQAYTARPEPTPEITAFMAAHPPSQFGGNSTQDVQNFEIVHRFEP